MAKKYFLALAVVIILFGCEGKEGPSGPSLTGNIVGLVSVIDSTGDNAGREGVFVQLEGTNYSTTSDSRGIWKISGVKTGTYIISCSKQGYSIDKNTSFQFVGGDVAADGGYYELYQLPTRYITTLSSPQVNQSILRLTGTLSSPPNNNSSQLVFTFLSRDSIATKMTSNYITYANNFVLTSSTFEAQFDLSFFSKLGIKAGDKLFLVSHTVVNTYAGYPDREKGFVYTGLCVTPSNVVSFIAP